MSLGSNNQFCLGKKWDFEYAIHSLRDQWCKTFTDAVLLIDAVLQKLFQLAKLKIGMEKNPKHLPISFNSD